MYSRAIEQYKKGLKLSQNQREVLIGILLGDAHLETQNQGQTYRLKIEQSQKHEDYVQHLYEIFKPWILTPPQLKKRSIRDHESWNCWFQTVSHGAFRFYAQQFYVDGQRRVPRLIHRWLTPCALSYWFMDDGSIKSRQSKGVILNTQGYPLNDIQRLVNLLQESFGLQAKTRKQREGFQIYISGKSYERFRELVEPHLIESMYYKLPKARQT